jgi:predicted DNA-binding protein
MSDQAVPRTPDEVGGFMRDLAFDPAPDTATEAALLDTLPAESPVMVVRSLRLPAEMDEAVARAAKTARMPKTAWIRQAIETALALADEDDEPISRADALRALTLLRPVRHVA